MRIPTLLQKISELSAKPETRTAIDIDLMLDYTRVLYADLLEWRSKLPATLNSASQVEPAKPAAPKPAINEPTLAEVAEAMEREKANTKEEEIPMVAANTSQGSIDQKIQTAPVTEKAAAAVSTSTLEQEVHSDKKDIRNLISINDKYQIMSELFGNDKTSYEQALDYINQSRNENTAMQWLREQLWITEDHTDSAQSFYEIVGRYFRS